LTSNLISKVLYYSIGHTISNQHAQKWGQLYVYLWHISSIYCGVPNLTLTHFGVGFDFPKMILLVSIINNSYIVGIDDNYIRSQPLQRRLLLLICIIKGICLDALTLKHDIYIPINTCQNSVILYHLGNEILAKCWIQRFWDLKTGVVFMSCNCMQTYVNPKIFERMCWNELIWKNEYQKCINIMRTNNPI
jgi:hypothetical protein